VPHASTVVPDDVIGQFVVSPAELALEVDLMTDHLTDRLYASPYATIVRFPVSRLVVDPERFESDDREVMASRGMGVIYTRTSGGAWLRRVLTTDERERLLDRYYRPHHAALTAAVAEQLDRHGHCLIIDAHSFPSRPLPYELQQDVNRPDICIGTDDFHTGVAARTCVAPLRGRGLDRGN
jgi:N-formylglutamate amidohydrolase